MGVDPRGWLTSSKVYTSRPNGVRKLTKRNNLIKLNHQSPLHLSRLKEPGFRPVPIGLRIPATHHREVKPWPLPDALAPRRQVTERRFRPRSVCPAFPIRGSPT